MLHQSYIYGTNHWDLDPDLQVTLSRIWPDYEEHRSEFQDFGLLAGSRVYEIADTVDSHYGPQWIARDLDGKRVDRARLSPAHASLLNDLAFINRPPYEGGSWHHHYCLGYLIADPGIYCSLIVTNQTAYAIYKYAPDLQQWVEPLLSGSHWGATWMTETQGGSDLGANLTQAVEEEDGWRVSGEEKYFASNAGLADLALVTARPKGARQGPKGLALYLVPRLAQDGELNFTVRRIKRKSATRAVPTGEVELQDSQAFLIGDAAEGIYYTLETLTVSRLANAIGAMGIARKAHLEALHRSARRTAFGKAIMEHPLLRYDLLDMAVRTAAGLALTFEAIEAFERAWSDRPPYSSDYHYARFLSHLVKNRTAEHAASVTQSAMEVFGGQGYMDEYAIARLHREALVSPIWEGTSNIQALDMMEAMTKKGAHEPFLDAFIPLLDRAGDADVRQARAQVEQSLGMLAGLSPDAAQWYGKDVLRTLADAAQVALLYAQAEHGGERYARLATLYAARFLLHESYPHRALDESELWDPLGLGS